MQARLVLLFLRQLLVIRISLFLSQPFLQAFLKKSSSDLRFSIVKIQIIARAE
jgi:hypothetical protein